MLKNLDYNYNFPKSSTYELLTAEQKEYLTNLNARRTEDANFNQQFVTVAGAGLLITQLGYLAFKLLE